MSRWNILVRKAESLREQLVTVHNLRCETVDLDLEEAYQELLRKYALLVSQLQRINPDYIQSFKEKCISESKRLEQKMQELDALLQQYNDDTLQEELNRCMARHVRLLDQASVLCL